MADKQSTGEATKSVQTSAVPNLADKLQKKSTPGTLSTGSADGAENSEKPAAQPTAYSMRPAFGEMFPLPTIKNIMNNVMAEKLKDKTYDKDVARTWTSEIADEVNQQIASSSRVKRYKHVVQVMLGQELGAGATYNSRCCWDCDCDTSVSEVFSNTSLFCVCTVFGTYQY
ncbi:dynein light chain Tctex-type protein 2B [Drosophila eugracilis]|uniref:dynein light chain Tctex-type protein 2B n=1 Tax=Drosophila eugracilis TaxID=29029 RepID=UPI001BDA7470|nr:dynein light chain Tctex-type protein 2B [Drosophila eugracilis]XP_017071902.2 dynein light chain Tctex-type protein 2B [Drosophila eugracilis]